MEILSKENVISQKHIDQALTYGDYRQLIDQLLEEGKTTGANQSEALFNYTKINKQRMKRWDKTSKIREDLKQAIAEVKEPWIWLVLTEGWCGDAAQNIPVIVKMAELNPLIEIKFLLRDENLDIMDAYLTNGGRSIPKLIALKANTLEELGTWGPRPNEVQKMVFEFKKDPAGDYAKFSETVHKWYAQDKTQSIQGEFLLALKAWNNKGL